MFNNARHFASRVLNIPQLAHDDKAANARTYRNLQQDYIHNMLADLKNRISSGDTTPSILGNIFRQGLLKDEEVLLASYTGIAAGVNLGYSLTWIVAYLANRPDLQLRGFEAIREVYGGKPPQPHEFDRVEYVKALHTVSYPCSLVQPRCTTTLTSKISGGLSSLHTSSAWLSPTNSSGC